MSNGEDAKRDAYEKIKPNISDLQRKVLACLIACAENGATDWELAGKLSMLKETVIARRNELMNMTPPLVANSGRRRVTPSGGTATVWVAIDPKFREKPKRIVEGGRGAWRCYVLTDAGEYRLIGYCSAKSRAEQWRVTGDTSSLSSHVHS